MRPKINRGDLVHEDYGTELNGQGVTPLLETRALTKRFAAVVANDAIDFEVRRGEIHCLLGENGAGKSTLTECLYGFYQPDGGEIYWKGKKVTITSPNDAMKLGIGMVHQHFMLVEPHSVTENILLGRKSQGVVLDYKGAKQRIRELCALYNVDLDPSLLIRDLSVGEQQWVEILKALYDGVDLLILDEPTAVLTPQESERLFTVLKKMSKEGLSIIFITHKLNEVIVVADRVTVLQKGKKVDTVNTRNVTKTQLARMMVGREVVFRATREAVEVGEPLLEVKNLVACNDLKQECIFGINISVYEREVLGIAGVAGNGQRELFEVLIGVRPLERGEIFLKGENITGKSPGYITSRGMANVPSDRIKEGLVPDFSISENLILGYEWKPPFRKRLTLNDSEIHSFAKTSLEAYEINAPSIHHKTHNLSGGNLQKVILARELGNSPKVLLANQPSRGLDVGVIEYVHREFLKKRSEGVGILLFSEDLDEIFTLSDRIAVIFKGEIVGLFLSQEADIEKIGLLMAGEKESR